MSNRNYSEATKSALFALTAKCYHPDCHQPSVTFFGDEPEKKVQIAHIHAVSPTGPRFKPMLAKEIDAFRNLILLCDHHHRLVDKKANEGAYPASLLKEWKLRAEGEVRSKVDGLDRLTEARLEEMLDNAARHTKSELDAAINSLRGVSEGAAEILQTMLNRIEEQFLNEDAIAALEAASYRLANLEEHAFLLSSASHRLEGLELNAAALGTAAEGLEGIGHHAAVLNDAADKFVGLSLSSLPSRVEEIRHSVVNAQPDVSGVIATIEYAGRKVVSEIEHRVSSIDLGEPPVVVNDGQRWKYFGAGVITALILVVTGAVLIATNTITI